MSTMTTATLPKQRRELIGRVARVIRHDPSTSFYAARLTSGESIVGTLDDTDAIEMGVQYRFLGHFSEHARYGLQFRFGSYVQDTPVDRRGVVAYLARSSDGRITEAKARAIWEAYGPDCLRVIRETPQCLVTDGLCKSAWEAAELSKRFKEQAATEKTTCELFDLFAGRGFPRNAIKDCIAAWGVRAVAKIRRDPFVMLGRGIAGVGFKRADSLYLELGHDPTRLKRQTLAAWDGLRDDQDGHTWHIEGAARKAILASVPFAAARFDAAIALGVRSGLLTTRRDPDGKLWITERAKASAELRVAVELTRLAAAPGILWPTLAGALEADDCPLTPHQRDGCRTALRGSVVSLGGSPGTGKTYVLAWLLGQLAQLVGRAAIAVAAPTGKAAVRITEALERYGTGLQATTIHRLLRVGRNGHDGAGWGFEHNAQNRLPHAVIAVDESSMLDVPLMASLLEAIRSGTHVIFVGDTHQLPPVGHGAPLRDLLAAGIPHAILTEIKRQDADSFIVTACHAIKDGRKFKTAERFDPGIGWNLRLIECEDTDAQLDTLTAVMNGARQGGKFPNVIEDVQVLCALNENSPVSRVPLNAMLQGLLNPPRDPASGEDGAASSNAVFRVGDKIICLRNSLMREWRPILPGGNLDDVTNYAEALRPDGGAMESFVANGDQGRVLAVDPTAVIARFVCPERTVRILMRKPAADAGSSLGTAAGGAAGDFALAYAITVHKSQGSEWPMVVVMLDEAAGMVASREHLYTAISRGKQLVVLIGKRTVADKRCRKVALTKRKTFLAELIRELRGENTLPVREALSDRPGAVTERLPATAMSETVVSSGGGTPGLCPEPVGYVGDAACVAMGPLTPGFDFAAEIATL